jgi:copper transport protein
LFLLALTVAMATPGSASAHARFLRSEPGAGAVLAHAPAAVRIAFDDVVVAAGGNEVVPNTGGPSVVAGKPRLTSHGKVLVLPLRRRLADGDYSVRWRIVSDDGHLESGVFAFAVGAGRPAPLPVLQAASNRPSARDVVFRWLFYAGILLAAGTAIFAAFVLRPVVQRLSLDRRVATQEVAAQRATALLLAGSLLAVVGTADFVREGSATRFGTAMVAGLALALLAAALALGSVVRRSLLAPALLCALALVPIPSVAGHALDAGVPWPNVPVDMLHLAAAAAWIGSLAGLVLVLPAANAAAGGVLGRPVVRRVSALALGSVAVLAATGIVRAVFELRTVSQLWTTGYGNALLVKSGLLLVLVVLGWANRRRLDDAVGVAGRVRVELVLLAGVVLAVSFLSALEPGRAKSLKSSKPEQRATLEQPPAQPDGAVVFAGQSGRFAVGLAVEPRRATVTVLAPSGGAEDGLEVSIAGTSAKPCGHGCYEADVALRPGPVRVLVAGRPSVFELPAGPRPADALVRRATRAFRAAHSVSYTERLSSGASRPLHTLWRLEAPDRLTYTIAGGPAAVVIGGTRWDRAPGERWERSETSAPTEPLPTWTGPVASAHVLSRDADTLLVSWANPQVPAWFTVRFDRRTLLPRELEMTAAAHFMHQTYLTFGRPRAIYPPR